VCGEYHSRQVAPCLLDGAITDHARPVGFQIAVDLLHRVEESMSALGEFDGPLPCIADALRTPDADRRRALEHDEHFLAGQRMWCCGERVGEIVNLIE
jgi:hypothetical protein